jgi:type VI secretion system protein ImpG
MLDGHVVQRGTRFVAAFREGISTRATYTSAQDVTLWPIALDRVDYLQDKGALNAAGLDRPEAEAGLRLTLSRVGPGSLAELSLDRLDLWFVGGSRGGAIFDAVFGHNLGAVARATKTGGPGRPLDGPGLIGVADREGLLPRVRPAFEGYRLMREYFLMPDRFHFLRLDGLNAAIRDCTQGTCEVVVYLSSARPEIADIAAKDFRLFVTPLVNLFEKECNVIDIDGRSAAHVVHADRTRPRDFEIYRLTNVEDADSDGPDAVVEPLYSVGQHRGSGLVYTTERRPRRPGEDEVRRGQTRTSYTGDDLFLSIARPADATVTKAVRRLDIRALCTNRDLPILDDNPKLSLETGDPVGRVELLSPFRRPRGSITSALPNIVSGGESQLDDLAWRLISQLSLNYLSLAEPGLNAEPLRAMLELYSGRGDPALSRHARSITRVRSRQVVERLGIPGPMCFGHGIEITLDVDESALSGGSTLLLSALLNQLFARHSAINSFVRTKTHLMQRQEDVSWPMSPGNRALI